MQELLPVRRTDEAELPLHLLHRNTHNVHRVPGDEGRRPVLSEHKARHVLCVHPAQIPEHPVEPCGVEERSRAEDPGHRVAVLLCHHVGQHIQGV